ncbi:MAG: hypothetical protein WCL16_12045, partial [bacterium]
MPIPTMPTSSKSTLSLWLKLRYLAEYAGLKTVLGLLNTLPTDASLAMARGVGGLANAACGLRRRVSIRNLRRTGVADDSTSARRLTRAAFQHMTQLVVETLWARYTPGFLEKHVSMVIPAATRALLDDPAQGLILATGHIGNWEVAGLAVGRLKPVVGLMRPLSNPYVDAMVQRLLPPDGFRIVPKHSPDIGRFPEYLRQGNVLALMIDQFAGDRGMSVPFFGQPAQTHTAIALLHLVTHAPLVFGWCCRTGPLQFEIRASDPIITVRTGRKQDDVRAVLSQLNAELERAIREAPEQYMW